MKFFVTVLMALTALTAVTADMDKYERMLKNWGKMKAMEGCFGEYNMKHWMLKMKAAKAKCSGMPAPELELDMFKGKVRTVNALISSGVTDKQNQFIDNMMREHFIKRLMRKQQMMELMGGDDEPDMPLLAKLRSRFARDADDEDMEMDNSLDLGDKMVQKLKNMEMAFTSDIGNMTCVLQECGVIDENMQIDVASMDKFADEGKWAAEDNTDGVDRTWLHAKVKDIHQMCKDLSDAVPESILNSCEMPHYITKIIYFKKCKMFHKVEACMMSDVRHKISTHGMSVAELSEKAGQKEDTMTGLMAFVLFGKM